MNKADISAIVIALINSGVIAAVARATINFIKANTKNKNVLLFTKWVEQGVNYAESRTDLVGEDKKKAATNFIVARITKNKLSGLFSNEQISAELEKAVADLHNWSPDVKENNEVK